MEVERSWLARRAKPRRTKVAAEIPAALDAYLAGGTAQELKLFDEATSRANEDIEAMIQTAEEIVASQARFARQMARLRRRPRKADWRKS